ncbi:hypothetical protein GGR53DRAFT_528127 [Hypoxylon sp. FL1150]|nr:hypothetical protein GGR53DRAFT_528127 [Hypoxylon sp. FL1150]
MPPSRSKELNTIYELAYSFLQRGELAHAETLFTKMNTLLQDTKQYSPLTLLQNRLQVASARLHLGKYKDGKKDIEEIQQGIQDFTPTEEDDEDLKPELDFNCRRWLAIYMLHTGQWENAAGGFEELLDRKWATQNARSSFKITRDLALAYAYRGEYEKARIHIKKARDLFNSQEKIASSSKYQNALFVKESGLEVVEATIDLLSGNHQRALKTTSKSLVTLENTLGPRHFKTLALANLKVWCLVTQGQYSRGEPRTDHMFPEEIESLIDIESLCQSTFDKLVPSLGRRHRLTLESMECLVRIFILQGRFAEAIDTGESLYSNVAAELGKLRPQTISCKYQQAAAHFAAGNYRTSELLYRKVVEEATRVLGPNHPKTVKYNYELARACLYHGEVEEALAIAIKAAAQQVNFQKGNPPTSSTPTKVHSLLEELSGCVMNEPESRLHPDLIYSFQLLAEIEVKKHRTYGLGGDLGTAEHILQFLVARQSSLGDSTSLLRTSLDYDLAIVLRERHLTGSNPSHDFIGILDGVVQNRKKLFGEDHPDTLRASRELLRSKFMRDIAEVSGGQEEKKEEWQMFLSTWEAIWASLEARYGPQFPQTLYSRLWYLIASTALGRSTGGEFEEETRKISEILSNSRLLSERLIETFLMNYTLVELSIKLRIPSLARELLSLYEDNIKKAKGEETNESLRKALTQFEADVEKLKASCAEIENDSNEDIAQRHVPANG